MDLHDLLHQYNHDYHDDNLENTECDWNKCRHYRYSDFIKDMRNVECACCDKCCTHTADCCDSLDVCCRDHCCSGSCCCDSYCECDLLTKCCESKWCCCDACCNMLIFVCCDCCQK